MEMTQAAFDAMVDAAVEALDQKNDALSAQFGLDDAPEWKADLQRPELQFLAGGKVVAVAELVVVGTLSHRGSWMWGWANESLPEHVRAASEPMKALGEETGLELFSSPKWSGDEELGWWVSALACSRLAAQGAYCMPGAKADVFALMYNVRRAAG